MWYMFHELKRLLVFLAQTLFKAVTSFLKYAFESMENYIQRFF
jgi:hypothetical protein